MVNDPRDAWMAAAFRSRAEHSYQRSDCPDAERIWDAVQILLPIDERLAIIDHVSECQACAEAWSFALELAEAYERTVQQQVSAFPPGRWEVQTPVQLSSAFCKHARLIGTAAVVLLALGVAFMMFRQSRPAEDVAENIPAEAPPDRPHAAAGPAMRDTPRVMTGLAGGSTASQDVLSRVTDHGTSSPSDSADDDVRAIRRLIAAYARSIETKDMETLRTIMPNLTDAQLAVVQRSFLLIDSQHILIDVKSVRIEGRTATARVLRQDTVVTTMGSGARQTALRPRSQAVTADQVMQFEKTKSGGWVLVSAGADSP